MNYKKLMVYVCCAAALLMVVYIANIISSLDYDNEIPEERRCENHDFDFEISLQNVPRAELEDRFPYHQYFSSSAYCDVTGVINSLMILNERYPNSAEQENVEFLIDAFTTKLQDYHGNSFSIYNPDSLILIADWADQFKVYEQITNSNKALYGIIHDFWISFIAEQLSVHSKQYSSIRYDFKFKYLQSICQSKRFPPSVTTSNVEKIITYAINSEFDYLFNRFWNGTRYYVKIVGIILISILLYLFYCTFMYNFKN